MRAKTIQTIFFVLVYEEPEGPDPLINLSLNEETSKAQ